VSPTPRPAVVLYRTVPATTLLTTLATIASPSGTLHAHGPVLHGPDGAEAAGMVEAVARSHGWRAAVWDGDSPLDPEGVATLVQETGAGLLLVEWDPADTESHELARELAADPPADLLLVRPGELGDIQQIVVGVGEGPNAPMLASLVHRWSAAFGVPAAALRVVEHAEEVPGGRALCHRVAPDLTVLTPLASDVLRALAEVGQRSGFIALGAVEGPSDEQLGPWSLGWQLTRVITGTIVVGRGRPGALPAIEETAAGQSTTDA
jgi:hypothetical protein